jgi:hypothetical protein
MSWELSSDAYNVLTENVIVTDLYLIATNVGVRSITHRLKPRSVTADNGYLTFNLIDLDITLTQGNECFWDLDLYCKVNYKDTDYKIATLKRFQSIDHNLFMSYMGINIFYVDFRSIKWSEILDLSQEGKDTSMHIIDFIKMHNTGVSKSEINKYRL